MGVLGDGVSEKPTLIKANIAWRRAYKPRDGMPFHIFRHIKSCEFKPQLQC